MTDSNSGESGRALNPFLNGTPEQRVEAWLSADKHEDGGRSSAGEWLIQLMPYVTLQSTSSSLPHPSVTLSYTCQSEHCNRMQSLHGGCAATLFDWATTLPLILVSKPGFWQYLGVSRTLNVTYLRPIPVGCEVLIECEIVQLGKRLCTIKGCMKRKSDGAVMAVCEHGKFNIDPEPKL